MCTGMESLTLGQQIQMGGTALGGVSQYLYHDAQATQAKADAVTTRDAAAAQAERILRATDRERGRARAATAASGAQIDDAALRVEADITRAGETDAAMTILSGERQARSSEIGARMQRASGLSAISSSAISAAYSGWKGAKGKPAESFHSKGWWYGGSGFEGE